MEMKPIVVELWVKTESRWDRATELQLRRSKEELVYQRAEVEPQRLKDEVEKEGGQSQKEL